MLYTSHTDDCRSKRRATASTVGVLLLVAVTLILALVTATFVLDLGEETDTEVPQATFAYDLNTTTGELTITHQSGDTIDGDKLGFGGAAQAKNTIGAIPEWSGQTIEAGDSATVTVTAGETLLIRYEDTAREESAVLSRRDIPLFAGTNAEITATASESAETGAWTGGNPGVQVEVDNFATPTGELYVVVELCDSDRSASRTVTEPGTTILFDNNDNMDPNDGELIELRTYRSNGGELITTQQVRDTGSSEPADASGATC